MRTTGLAVLSIIMLSLFAAGAAAQEGEPAAVPADSARFVRSTPSYSSGGQRDPFDSLAPVEDEDSRPIKGLFNYENGSLKGIVRTDDSPYAMVVDDDGMSYVLYENSRVRGGYVSRITDDAVYLSIVKYGRAMTIVFRTEESKNMVVESTDAGDTMIRKPGITVDYDKSGPAAGDLTISDVVVPQGSIRTVEETWFGVPRNVEPGVTVERGVQRNMFALYEPYDDAVIALPYEFDWTDPEGDVAGYTLIIDDDPDFSSPAVTVRDIPVSAYLVTGELKLPEGMRLHWRVIATGSNGGRITSYRSDMSFTIQNEDEVEQ